MNNDMRIRPVTFCLALYLLLGTLDALNIAYIGSFLKILAFVPLGALMLDMKQLRLCFHSLLWIQLSFWILALFSLFWSVSVDRTLSSNISLTLNLMFVLSLGMLVPYNTRELDFIQRAMLWSCWIQIACTLLFADFSADGRLTLRFGESVQDQNNNNTFFLYAFSYHCYRFLSKKERIQILPVMLIITMVLISGSRGALMAFMITFLYHIFHYYRKSKHALRSALVIIIVMTVLGIAFNWILSYLPESVAIRYTWSYLEEKGTVGRAAVWKYLLNLFSNSSIPRMLFGHGYGTTIIVNQLNHRVAHNLYLDNLITLGLWGMLLQIATQCSVLWIFYKRKKYALFGAYLGMIGMCMSLTLSASKPLWNMIMIALAIDCNSTDCLDPRCICLK